MTLILQTFIDALREEMQQLGEMLAVLDSFHETACRRSGQSTDALAGIGAQHAAIQSARARRQGVQRQLAADLAQPEPATFAQLLPLLPKQYQPLVGALIQENYELLERVEQRAKQPPVLRKGPGSAALNPAASVSSSSCPGAEPPSAGSDRSGSLVPDAPVNTMDPRSLC